MTASDQSLEDWISEPAAAALRRFSGAANKSTGASHPSDQARWFAFIVAMHRGRDRLDAHQLYRWLWEVEGWDEESSFSLAGEYERLLALLVYADQH
ncbi:hypothetical protein [Brevundimonas sp.]|uniref:hypothetical protein n=1 Tax=Brevundimonas sp. TaxID=1871086 RepID=UPI00257D6A8E|nr:hypothetical protein [Brevundimonas sp.]